MCGNMQVSRSACNPNHQGLAFLSSGSLWVLVASAIEGSGATDIELGRREKLSYRRRLHVLAPIRRPDLGDHHCGASNWHNCVSSGTLLACRDAQTNFRSHLHPRQEYLNLYETTATAASEILLNATTTRHHGRPLVAAGIPA